MNDPLGIFRFRVDFYESTGREGGFGGAQRLCGGAFSQCSGLEATMEPFTVKEGGRNYGELQRAGRTSFATLVLKRGMTDVRDLWRWFDLVANGGYAFRLNAVVTVLAMGQAADDADGAVQWRLINALPTRFKAADLDGKGSEVAIEELHVVHEGLHLGGAG